MAKGYTFVRVRRFPSSGESRIPVQLRLEGCYETAVTRYILSESNFHVGYDEYEVHHELVEKTHGRVWGKDFHEYLRPWGFKMYLNRQLSLLLVCAPKDVVGDFLGRANTDAQGCDVERLAVDFAALTQRLSVILGAWVNNIRKQNLHTAAYFGKTVDKSEEFIAAAQVGKVGSLQTSHTWSGDDHFIQVTKDGGVVLFQNYDTKDELELLTDIYDKLLRHSMNGSGK